MTIPVLMYHSISAAPGRSTSEFVVSRAAFEEQLRFLAHNGWRTPPLSEVVREPAAAAGDARRVVLTFDDGYEDNHRVALPLLVQYGFRATIFVVADLTHRRNWWDRVVPGGASLLSPWQLRELSSFGVEIGSHGMTHRRMDSLSPAQRCAELVDSRRTLEDVLGKPVEHFAWPYGAVSEECKRAAREAGYAASFAVHSGPLVMHQDLQEVRRIFMGERSDAAYMMAKLSLVERIARWGHWAVKRARTAREGRVALSLLGI